MDRENASSDGSPAGCSETSYLGAEGQNVKIWFEGEGEIATDIATVAGAYADLGGHYVDVVSRMPGMSSVELIEQGSDFVKIRTNEGVMHRSNITRTVRDDRIVVAFDEAYKAGSKVAATSHFTHTFSATDDGVHHHLVVSDLEFPGVLGFFYRNFGRASMGKAFLGSYKACFESASP